MTLHYIPNRVGAYNIGVYMLYYVFRQNKYKLETGFTCMEASTPDTLPREY